MPKYVFRFVEYQDKATFGLGYKLTRTRNEDATILDKTVGIADARIKYDHIYCDVPQKTPSNQQQGVLSKQISSRTPTELRYK